MGFKEKLAPKPPYPDQAHVRRPLKHDQQPERPKPQIRAEPKSPKPQTLSTGINHGNP